MSSVILVNEQDEILGEEEKLKAHQLALCHRAFSIFIFKDKIQQEVLLQQRAKNKYHCGGLWTNTCCSHPQPFEKTLKSGQRRLQEELGFSVPLKEVGVFHYQAEFDNGLTENEVDHVLMGFYSGKIIPDQNEIADFSWVKMSDLKKDLKQHPNKYTPWFLPALKIITSTVFQHLAK